MRKPMMAGNWKMNKTIAEAVELAKSINASDNVAVVVGPPFTALKSVVDSVANKGIAVAAQNMYTKEEGAYTGEISPDMISDAGCTYVILGHSERRDYFKESNSFINEKVKLAMSKGLYVILCIGETLEQRTANQTNDVLAEQLEGCLSDVSDLSKLVIAYEPVWAIGTGEVATPQQAQDAHSFIRNKIKGMYSDGDAGLIRILYGGSMKPANAEELLKQPDIDGGLIGGAALVAESFNELILMAEKYK